MLSTNQGSPLLRVVVIGAGIVIIAAGMKATATVVNLVLLPFGTALGAYACWVLLKDEGRKLFT